MTGENGSPDTPDWDVTLIHASRWPADWDRPIDAPGLAELVGRPSQISLDDGLSDVEEQHPENIELGEN